MAGKLIDIFQNCKCVKEEKHLAAGEVRSLAFGDNNTVMVVELGLHEVVSRKVIARAEKQIADTYGLDRVMIEPRYNMPGELSDAYHKSLYDDMAYRSRQPRVCFDHRKWAFADGALQIPMDEVSESISQTHCGIWRRVFSGSWGEAVRCTRSARTHRILHPHPGRRRAARKFCTRLWSKRRQPQRKRPSRKSRVRRRSSTPAISAARREGARGRPHSSAS